jgi:ubiquinone biosynthesis protein
MMTLKGQTKFNLDINTGDETSNRIEGIFNKLSFSIVCAALIIGSSIIAASDMNPKMRGFPLWSIVGYTCAAVLLVWLVMNIGRKRK